MTRFQWFFSIVKRKRGFALFSHLLRLVLHFHLPFELGLLYRMKSGLNDLWRDWFRPYLHLHCFFLFCLFLSDHFLYFALSNWFRSNFLPNLKAERFWHSNAVPSFKVELGCVLTRIDFSCFKIQWFWPCLICIFPFKIRFLADFLFFLHPGLVLLKSLLQLFHLLLLL